MRRALALQQRYDNEEEEHDARLYNTQRTLKAWTVMLMMVVTCNIIVKINRSFVCKKSAECCPFVVC